MSETKTDNEDIKEDLKTDDLIQENNGKDFPGLKYCDYFNQNKTKSIAQPGILQPPLASMGFILLQLNYGNDIIQQALNALISIENIELPPYIASNSTQYPTDKNKLNENYESILSFANRTSNLLPTNLLHISFGFGYNFWSKKLNKESPKGFLPFNNWTNKYSTTKAKLPFNEGNKYYKDYFDIPKDSINYDICIQIKSASDSLIQRVFAHAIKLYHDIAKIETRLGFCKQRNQFGFFDAASKAEFTANSTLTVGPICRAFNTEKGNENRKKYGDQFVDLGRYTTIFIGDEEKELSFKNGTFAVLANFVHDLNNWNKLTENEQTKVFGRKKASGALDLPNKKDNPLAGGLNVMLPHSHIVRTHIRGIDKFQCPHSFKFNKKENEFTWLFEASEQNDTDNNEASKIPMEIYRQATSYKTENDDHGLYFFGLLIYLYSINIRKIYKVTILS